MCFYFLGEEEEDEENSPSKGRHKIRKVIKDKNLAEETKGAAADERDRRKRIEERQAAYNKIFSIPEGRDATCHQLVLDFDPESKEVLVEVNKKLVTKLKPHQVKIMKISSTNFRFFIFLLRHCKNGVTYLNP